MENIKLEDALMAIFEFCRKKYNTDEVYQEGENKETQVTEKTSVDDVFLGDLMSIINRISEDNKVIIDSVQGIPETIKLLEDKTQSRIGSLQESITLHSIETERRLDSLLSKQDSAYETLTALIHSMQNQINQFITKMKTDQQNHQNELNIANAKITEIQREKENAEKDNQEKSLEIKQLRESISKAQTELENTKFHFMAELSKYGAVDNVLEAKDCLDSLESESRSYIEQLCEGSDILAFISLGRDENRLNQLWQYLRNAAVCDKPDVPALNTYFEFCIDVRNASRPISERYSVYDISIGDEFNLSRCIKTNDSVQIGSVAAVLTKCIVCGSEVKYKAVVKVK